MSARALRRLQRGMLQCGLLLAGCAGEPAAIRGAGPETLLRTPAAPAISGKAFQQPDTQALQDDPFANPGLLWVDRGETLWHEEGAGPACSTCHGSMRSADSAVSKAREPQPMAAVAHRYPRYDPETAQLINLEQRINRCRTAQQHQPAYSYESEPLLALTAYLMHQAQGTPVVMPEDPAALPYLKAGEQYFYERRGQMNLACHHCHEQHAGRQLRGDRLSQGQSNGYPTYRLEWQTLGSLHRRLRFCNAGIRAEPHAFGAPEYVNLELYLKWRGRGLPIESPALRR